MGFWQRLTRTETLSTLFVLGASTVMCWFGKLDGTAWVAAATMATGILTAGRSYVKGKAGEE